MTVRDLINILENKDPERAAFILPISGIKAAARKDNSVALTATARCKMRESETLIDFALGKYFLIQVVKK